MEHLNNRQENMLNLFWESEDSQSVEAVFAKSKHFFAEKLLFEYTINKLIRKGFIARAGTFGYISSNIEFSSPLYIAKISFADHYSEKFKRIAPSNLFRLIEKLLQSDKLNVSMLESLDLIIHDRIKETK